MTTLPDARDLEDFQVDDLTEPTLTINVQPQRYEQYRMGVNYLSRDEDVLLGEDAVANVKALYARHELEAPSDFTSMAVRWKGELPRTTTTLSSYGEIVLVLRPELFDDVIVFNGDVKNLANEFADGHDKSAVSDGRPDETWLDMLVQNNAKGKSPRLVGNYVEARLPRALTREDILEARRTAPRRPSKHAAFRRST